MSPLRCEATSADGSDVGPEFRCAQSGLRLVHTSLGCRRDFVNVAFRLIEKLDALVERIL